MRTNIGAEARGTAADSLYLACGGMQMHSSVRFSYVRPPDLELRQPRRVPIVIAGAGLVGLTLALDLALRGVRTIVLEARDTLAEGSRAIVFAQRSIEILMRLGLGARMLEKGVGWKLGRVFYKDREAFSFDFQSEAGYGCPAFINIQQSYIEQWLVEACEATGLVDLRAQNRVAGIERHAQSTSIDVDTPDGRYALICDWLVACDGARSFVRSTLQLPLVGKMFHDRFLIVDVEMDPGFSAERRFWFDPPFHPGHAVLVHKQPDNLWRVDFQLGPDADPVAERQPERVAQRLRAMFGDALPFTIDWISVYTFRCRRLERFVHSRVVFAGDSAHEVSPFGGRGGNGGIQDADNLGWKLAAIVNHGAPASLIRSYDEERLFAADENILNSTRSAHFISPESPAVEVLREATLRLARHTPLGRALVNSGRLSRPAMLQDVGQFGHDAQAGALRPGTPARDAPIECEGQAGWLMHYIGRKGFTVLLYADPAKIEAGMFGLAARSGPPVIEAGTFDTADRSGYPVEVIVVSPVEPRPASDATRAMPVLWDRQGLVARRYGLQAGNAVLLRPDQHVLDAFPAVDSEALGAAIERALDMCQPAVLMEGAQ
jgi:3-(3-hydroxy-phenyl)propionate hydroxylase